MTVKVSVIGNVRVETSKRTTVDVSTSEYERMSECGGAGTSVIIIMVT